MNDPLWEVARDLVGSSKRSCVERLFRCTWEQIWSQQAKKRFHFRQKGAEGNVKAGRREELLEGRKVGRKEGRKEGKIEQETDEEGQQK